MLRNLTGEPLRVYQPQQRLGTAADAAACVRADAYAHEARLVASRGAAKNAATQAKVRAEYLRLAELEAEKAEASRKRVMILAAERAHQQQRQQQEMPQPRQLPEQQGHGDRGRVEPGPRGSGNGLGSWTQSLLGNEDFAKARSSGGSSGGAASASASTSWFKFGKSGGGGSAASSTAADTSSADGRLSSLSRKNSLKDSKSESLSGPQSPALSAVTPAPSSVSGGATASSSGGGGGGMLGATLKASQAVMSSLRSGKSKGKSDFPAVSPQAIRNSDPGSSPVQPSAHGQSPSPLRGAFSALVPANGASGDNGGSDGGSVGSVGSGGSGAAATTEESALAVWSPLDALLASQARAEPLLVHLQYLSHRQRGALFFAPTKTVQRCHEVWEVPFDVQEETVGPHETVLYAPARPRRIDAGAAFGATGFRAGDANGDENGDGGGGCGSGGGGGSSRAPRGISSSSRGAMRRAWDAHQAREAAAAAQALHKRAGAGDPQQRRARAAEAATAPTSRATW